MEINWNNIKEWIIKWIKFNLAGTFCFTLATLAFYLLGGNGLITWFVANLIGQLMFIVNAIWVFKVKKKTSEENGKSKM